MPKKERKERAAELLDTFSLTEKRTSAPARCRAA
jgi:ABC-type methionine transport system ATPase subunit